METKRRLRMIFDTEDGKGCFFERPKARHYRAGGRSAMNTIITRSIFGIPPLSIVGAELVETGTTKLI